MRAILDVNILISAMIVRSGPTSAIVDAWLDGRFTLLTCRAHLAEVRSTLRKPRIAALIKPHKAGRLINQIRRCAEDIRKLPLVRRSPDPGDDYLLALAEAGNANYLVTGDKSGLLVLETHHSTRIISASRFASLLDIHHGRRDES